MAIAAEKRDAGTRPAESGDGGVRDIRDRSRALRVTLPPGWHRSRANVVPRVADPHLILTLATFRPSVTRRPICGSRPDVPHVRLGADDVLLIVTEELSAQPGNLPRRPRRFAVGDAPWPCLSRRGVVGLRSSFRAHGRLIEVKAAAGARTTERQRRVLLGVAESLRFGPTPPVAVSVRPLGGRPGTRFELSLRSTHPTGRRGRRERSYWAAVHGPLKTACVIQNEAWFSYGPPGRTLRAVLDPRRTKGGRWCRGRFRGVVRYRDAICPAATRCERVYIRRAGRFGFTVR